MIRIYDGTTTTTYTYDGDGSRTSKTSGTATTTYVWDPNRSTPVVLADSTFKYVYGLGLDYAVTGGGSLGVYHTDGLGSVRAITDENGNLVEAYLTDAFGVSLGSEGTVTQPFGFTGQQQDSESGLYYLRARYYSPTLGRFISRDPTFGSVTNPLSLNRFGYALDNPGLLVDPSGLSANRVTGGGSGDNPCFSTGGGRTAGYVNNAACDNIIFNGVVPIATQLWPGGPSIWFLGSQPFAAAPGGNGRNDNGEIDVTRRGWQHVLDRHIIGGALVVGKSIFSAGEDVRQLIIDAAQSPAVLQSNGNFKTVVDAGRVIGYDIATSGLTSRYTVITNAIGKLITAYPGQ